MPKDIDDVIKELTKHNKELDSLEKRLSKDIANIHKEQKSISSKLDTILDILNMLSIFIEEEEALEDEDDEDPDYYESNEGWIPEKSEWDIEEDDD